MNKQLLLILFGAFMCQHQLHAKAYPIVPFVSSVTTMTPVSLNIKSIVPPHTGGGNNHRIPIQAPLIYIDGQRLYLPSQCEGMTLQLFQYGKICYETIIHSSQIELPAIGDVCELNIINGTYIFYTDILI